MTEEADALAKEMPALRRFALALTRDPEVANDLVQEALLRGHERRRGLRSTANLKSWLFSILKNTFLDHRRNRLSRERREAAVAAFAPASIDAPQDAIVRLAQLREAFFALPEDQREALSLIALEGLTYAEAAKLADVPLGTLMSRVARARASLRAFEAGEAGSPANGAALRVVGGRDADQH